MIGESWASSLARSDYIGWAAYVEGTPLMEHVAYLEGLSGGGNGLAQPVPGALVIPPRPLARNVVKWRDVPQRQVERLELYFARHVVPPSAQPVVRLDRPAGTEVRWIMFKSGGAVLRSVAVSKDVPKAALRDLPEAWRGQERLGVTAYTVGYWAPKLEEAQMVEVRRNIQSPRDILHHGPVRHPCWPRPHGFGLTPEAVGLQAHQVPSPPNAPEDMVGGIISGGH